MALHYARDRMLLHGVIEHPLFDVIGRKQPDLGGQVAAGPGLRAGQQFLCLEQGALACFG